jgi:hypothetical protein
MVDSKTIVDFGNAQGQYKKVEVGEVILFNRGEYEKNNKPWLTDIEFQELWDSYLKSLSNYFEFTTTEFILNGNGGQITIAREIKAGAAIKVPCVLPR